MRCKFLSTIAVILFILCGRVGGSIADPGVQAAPASEEAIIPLQWLDKQTTVEQAETEHMVDGVPFGASNNQWKQLKALLQPGDALWTYCSSWESFKALAGRCGMALVRSGRVVTILVTTMN